MDHDAVLTLFDDQMRQHTRGGERSGDVVRQVGADGDWNGVVWSALDQAGADAAIAEQVRYFTSLGRDFEWKLYSYDRPDDLGARLRAAGFVPEPAETVMVAEVRGLPTAVELPEGVELHPVTDAAGVDLMADVHEQAFGTSSARLREQMLAQLAQSPDTVTMVIAMAGDVPVCAARMELHPGTEFASLWGGGTVAAWRGRGNLPGPDRPPGPYRRRERRPLPPGRRLQPEPADPAAPRVRPAEYHHAVRVRTVGHRPTACGALGRGRTAWCVTPPVASAPGTAPGARAEAPTWACHGFGGRGDGLMSARQSGRGCLAGASASGACPRLRVRLSRPW